MSKKRSKAAVFQKKSSDRHFDECVQRYFQASADIWAADPGAAAMGRKQLTEIIKRMKSVEIPTKKRIFKALWEHFEGAGTAMDLFSGSGLATIPLVTGKRIEGLTMVDDMETSPKESFAGISVIHDDIRFKLMNIHIDKSTPAGALPPVENVILADSGVAIAPSHRKPEHLTRMPSTDPRMYESAAIIDPDFGLKDLLRILADVESRVIHILETPFFLSKAPLEVSRDYIESEAETEGWMLNRFAPIGQSQTFHAVLNRSKN